VRPEAEAKRGLLTPIDIERVGVLKNRLIAVRRCDQALHERALGDFYAADLGISGSFANLESGYRFEANSFVDEFGNESSIGTDAGQKDLIVEQQRHHGGETTYCIFGPHGQK
jgi:hypothetical protein